MPFRRPRSPGRQPRLDGWVSVAIAAVASHAAEYCNRWVLLPLGTLPMREGEGCAMALRLIAAGLGPARVPTCNHTLSVMNDSSAHARRLLRRTLELYGPGELQELCMSFSGDRISAFIMAVVEEQDALPPSKRSLSRALESLRVVRALSGSVTFRLIERFGATLAELDCATLPWNAERMLECCTRLESLHLPGCRPAAWLGLSQLHTLRGVSLQTVPIKTIASALPRLHTLHVRNGAPSDFSLDGFYDDLLPRLRSFHLVGWWPRDEGAAEGAPTLRANPLPLLEDLKWWRADPSLRGQPPALPRGFMGARPMKLETFPATLKASLVAVDTVTVETPPTTTTTDSLLARVRELTGARDAVDPADMARWLHAAPQLRHFASNAPWLVRGDATEFAGAVHPRLRSLTITTRGFSRRFDVPADAGVRLRQSHFPRLRRLDVDGMAYPMWLPDAHEL